MKQLIAFTIALCVASTGWAMPITGDLGIAGDVSYDDTSGILAFSNEHIIGASGDFDYLSPIELGALTAFYNVDIGDIDVSASPATAAPWTLVDFVFTPLSISTHRNGHFFDFILRGVMSATGFDDTEYVFALSTNPGGVIGTFSAATVPEPSAVALLVLGFLCVVALRRRATQR